MEKALSLRALIGGVLVISVAACGPKAGNQPPAPPPIAQVDGEPVSAALFDYYVQERTGQSLEKIDLQTRNRLLDDLIALEAAAAVESRAPKAGIDQKVELARLDVLSKAAAEDAGVFAAPTDEELQSAYQSFLAGEPKQEYHIAHVLVATEALAVRAIDDLNHGADFAALAKERSADDSKARGGDLGWISGGRLPKALIDSASALKPGQYTKQPVQTAYGWHVIKLIEARPVAPPTFDQVKAQLAVNLQQQRREKFMQEALAKATVERPAASSGGKISL